MITSQNIGKLLENIKNSNKNDRLFFLHKQVSDKKNNKR